MSEFINNTVDAALDDDFGALAPFVQALANHSGKFLRASRKHREVLTEASEWSRGQAPLDRPPENPRTALRAIDQFARSYRHRRSQLFGAYFAHHHLRLQAAMADRLASFGLEQNPELRPRCCMRMYAQADAARRGWVAALLELSLEHAAPELSKRDYTAFNVGALIDYEDVDLAIVVRTEEARQQLARGFAKVSKIFLQYASKIQMFLTEEFMTASSAAPIGDYEQLLKKPRGTIVSVNQLLGAQYLCGDLNLARALRERVIDLYYVGQGDPMVHEGFLRSALQELRFHLEPHGTSQVLSPKSEIYVPSKLALTSARVVHGVVETRPLAALERLVHRDPAHAASYEQLKTSFAQTEILRALLFQYVMPGDFMDLADPVIAAPATLVARMLGLGPSARKSAAERLYGFYTGIRGRGLHAVAEIASHIDEHLQGVSTFRKLIERQQLRTSENLARELIVQLEQHRGAVFWDEIVELLSANPKLAARFLADLQLLPEKEREEVAARYVSEMIEDSTSMLEALIFIATVERESNRPGPRAAEVFFRSLVNKLRTNEEAIYTFTVQLDAEAKTEQLFRLSTAYPAESVSDLAKTLDTQMATTRGKRVLRALQAGLVLAHHRSNALGRTCDRVFARTPEALARMSDGRRMRDLEAELRRRATLTLDPAEKFEILGDAFDVATLGASIAAIVDANPARKDKDFVAAVDQYVRDLFQVAFVRVKMDAPEFERILPSDGFAIFATGGYGRKEAFGSDWDYIAVVENDNPTLQKFVGRVLQRVSGAMVRRGLRPHNRLTDYFSAYSVSLRDFGDYLSARTPETFVDEAEILEARFVLGDASIQQSFNEQIRDRVLFENRRAFLDDILNELSDRQDFRPVGLNIKLGRGGLREIHLLWLAVRAYCRLPSPVNETTVPQVIVKLPEIKESLEFLRSAHRQLRHFRDLHRLVIAQDNTVDAEALAQVAQELPPLAKSGVSANFRADLQKLMASAAAHIDRVARVLQLQEMVL